MDFPLDREDRQDPACDPLSYSKLSLVGNRREYLVSTDMKGISPILFRKEKRILLALFHCSFNKHEKYYAFKRIRTSTLLNTIFWSETLFFRNMYVGLKMYVGIVC